jgi:sugar/nucleoside kinase (ribokinase family)
MSPKGTFIGLNTIDIQFLIDNQLEENKKYKANKNEIVVGGPGTNAAVCFSYLGGHANLYTAIGNHHFTNFIYDDLKSNKLNITDLIHGETSEPTIASIITTEQNGNRTVFSYHPKQLEIKNENHIKLESDIILTDGFYIDAAIEIINATMHDSIPVVLDGGSWKPGMEKLLKYIDIAICSENFCPPGIKKHNEIFKYLHDFGTSKVAITQGEKPILYSINGSKGQIYVEQIQAVDTLGAGDFFHGAFCYYFTKSNDFVESLIKASKIAAKSCKYFGTREWMKIEANEK